MTTPKTISELAAEANSYLYTGDGIDKRAVVLPKSDAPQWFTDLCHSAHKGLLEMFPDDWRYEFIQDALTALENDGEECEPDIDSLYPYTADRLRWLSSRLDRTCYCDEAMKEFGGDFKDTDSLIALGMYYELSEVFGLVKEALEDRLEELEDEAAEAEEEADEPAEVEGDDTAE